MAEANKNNLQYFENPTMRGLYEGMEEWQHTNQKRLLSVSIQQDGGKFCCTALTNPTEVVITDLHGRIAATVYNSGELAVAVTNL